jgi:hypothetical protein
VRRVILSRSGCINSHRQPRKIPQGLKPSVFAAFTARLKPCPFKARFMQPVLVFVRIRATVPVYDVNDEIASSCAIDLFCLASICRYGNRTVQARMESVSTGKAVNKTRTVPLERIPVISRPRIQQGQKCGTDLNRYFNPPDRIHQIGRRLQGADFAQLVSGLRPSEVLIGLYRNQVGALVATHLHSLARMNEMEGLWAPAEGYYAVPQLDANAGFEESIPVNKDELR